MNWTDPTIVAGFIQAIGTLGAGGIAGLVAWTAIDAWRTQELGRRAIGYAEDCLMAADEVIAFVAVARSRGFSVHPRGGNDSSEAIRNLIIEKQSEALESARAALIRCRSLVRRIGLVTGTTHEAIVDRVEKDLWHLLQTLFLIREIGTPSPQEHEQRTQLADLRADFMGMPRIGPGLYKVDWATHCDPIDQSLKGAHRELEASLRPLLLGRKQRRKSA